MEPAPEVDLMGGSQDNFTFFSCCFATHLCLISLTSSAKCLSWTSMLNKEELGEREWERQHGAFYLDPNNSMDQTGWDYEKDL